MAYLRSIRGGLRLTLAILLLAVGAAAVHAQQVLGPAGTANPGVSASGQGAIGSTGESGYLDLNAGIAYTDNAALTAENQTGDGIAMVGFNTDYARHGSRLDVSAIGQIDWVAYFHHTFGSTPYGNFLANIMWGHSTDVLQWELSEAFGETTANPLSPPSPANMEFVSYFTTGPYINLNFDASNRATLHGLYSKTSFQNSPYDGESYDGGATLVHSITPAANISLHGDFVRTQFADEAIAPAYDTRLASLVYQVTGQRTNFSAIAGYSIVNYNGANSGAPLFEARMERRMSSFSDIWIQALTGYTTIGDALGSSLRVPVGAASLSGTELAAASTAPFKEHSASVGWNFSRSRTSLSIFGTLLRNQYQQQELIGNTGVPTSASSEQAPAGIGAYTGDEANVGGIMMRQARPFLLLGSAPDSSALNNTEGSVSVVLSRRLRPTLTVSLDASRTSERFENLDESYTDTYAMLSLGKQFSRITLVAYFTRWHRSVSQTAGAAAASPFDEDLVGVYLTYGLVGHRTGETSPLGLPGLVGVPAY